MFAIFVVIPVETQLQYDERATKIQIFVQLIIIILITVAVIGIIFTQ